MSERNTTPPPSSNRTCRFPASGSYAGICRRRARSDTHGGRLTVKLQSQRGNTLRHPFHERPRVRSGILIQAGFPSSYQSTPASRPLRSTVVTRFPATMSLSDSRTEPACGYAFPHTVGGSPTAWPGLPGSSTDLSTRAVPYHPGEPDDCTYPLLHRRLQASSIPEEWPLPACVTRPNRVRLRYGSRVRRTRLRARNYSQHALDWLPVEWVTVRVNTSQFTRSARLGLAHRTHTEEKHTFPGLICPRSPASSSGRVRLRFDLALGN